MERINVTKSFLPPKEEYINAIQKIWENNWLTNNGPVLLELEAEIKKRLNNPFFLLTSNGTVSIQIALKALGLKGEIITTPFSYCATTTSLIWENLEPVFVDISPSDFNINPDLIEEAITPYTTAILATHVYGNPCEVEKIESIAQKHNLKVIYDAAHAFGVEYKGKSLLNYGDISTCSFHSTKVFHTIEGGGIICNDEELHNKMMLMRSFGHNLDDYFLAGINGKNSEFHSAMGLVNLIHLEKIIDGRKRVFRSYDQKLNWDKLYKPTERNKNIHYNFAYYPVVFQSEKVTLEVIKALNQQDIFPRRYFYPSLNTLGYIKNKFNCPVSEDVSLRVLSLPLYPDLEEENISRISAIINSVI